MCAVLVTIAHRPLSLLNHALQALTIQPLVVRASTTALLAMLSTIVMVGELYLHLSVNRVGIVNSTRMLPGTTMLVSSSVPPPGLLMISSTTLHKSAQLVTSALEVKRLPAAVNSKIKSVNPSVRPAHPVTDALLRLWKNVASATTAHTIK